MLDVVGVGTNSVDEVLQLPGEVAAVLAGGKVRVSDRRFLCGGQTATVMAACAALGLRSGYLGAFGSDEHGRLIRNALKSCGVDVRGSIDCDAPNRGAVILVDPHGTRTVLWHRSDRLKVPLPGAARLCAARRASCMSTTTILSWRCMPRRSRAAPALRDERSRARRRTRVEQLIASVTFPIFEQNLPATLTGEHDPERALRKLRRLNDGLLVMTRGERGAVALDGDTFHVAPAFKVKVVDGTGAGDVFRAGFIYGLLQKWPVPEHASLRECGCGIELHEARRDTVGACARQCRRCSTRLLARARLQPEPRH